VNVRHPTEGRLEPRGILKLREVEARQQVGNIPLADGRMRSPKNSRTTHTAMVSGLSETGMDWADMVEAMDADPTAKKRRPYRKREVVA
jgi:hypothetical protein